MKQIFNSPAALNETELSAIAPSEVELCAQEPSTLGPTTQTFPWLLLKCEHTDTVSLPARLSFDGMCPATTVVGLSTYPHRIYVEDVGCVTLTPYSNTCCTEICHHTVHSRNCEANIMERY